MGEIKYEIAKNQHLAVHGMREQEMHCSWAGMLEAFKRRYVAYVGLDWNGWCFERSRRILFTSRQV